jgi:5-methylcytosine-specific restriction enzyme subunit McrC
VLQYFDAVESEWTTVPITASDAAGLRAAGERLVPATAWWGTGELDTDPEDPQAAARSAVHCRMTTGGHWQVRVADRIGLVATGDVAVRVHPKIPVEHALFLFRKAHHGLAAAMTVDDARVMAEAAGGFWELICHAFVREAERVIARDLVRDYELDAADLVLLRGRVHMATSARRALQGVLRFACEFDEYTADAPINRYLKAACGSVARSSVLSSSLRRRAMRIRAEMAEVGEIEPGDRQLIHFDRRTAHYRDAVRLADLVLDAQGETWRPGVSPGVAYLLRTPLLMQRGLQEVLSEGLGSRWTIRPQKVALRGIGEWINPDLVFGKREAVADVKYKRASDVWDRAELYEIVAFAEHLGVTRAAILDFRSVPRLTVGVGDITITHVRWDLAIQDPAEAARKFTRDVDSWLESQAAVQ